MVGVDRVVAFWSAEYFGGDASEAVDYIGSPVFSSFGKLKTAPYPCLVEDVPGMLGVDGLDKECDREYGRVHRASPEEGACDLPPSTE